MLRTITLFILSLISISSNGQFTNILISPVGCTEPSICIDPTDVSRVVAATNCTYSYYSSDTGRTWNPCNNLSITPGVWCYDPCIVADYTGNFFYFHNFQITPNPMYITMQKSFDGGQTWSFDNTVPHLFDKEMACVRPSTNEIYTTFIPDSPSFAIVGFSKTSDGGITWTPVSQVNQQSYLGYQWGAAPVPGPGGELYVVWENTNGVYFQKSMDNGNTWMFNDVFLSPFLNTGNGYNCMPSIATDLSTGPYSGSIYITWWELDANGTDTDIYFAKSTDAGTTWTINSLASDISTDQKWPQIATDPVTGFIYVIYYSQVGITSGDQIRLAFSDNGGNSFVTMPVSETPATVTNWYHHYIGNSAYNGVIRPAWTTNDSLYTALISEQEIYLWLSSQQYDVQSGMSVFPNPTTGIVSFSASSEGSLLVYNSTGEVVWQKKVSGQLMEFDLSHLDAGLYLVTMETVHGTASRKLIKR